MPLELEAANQRLIASDRENRSSSRPRGADAIAARSSSKEVEDAKRAAATLRQQVQHQSEVIDRLKRDVGDRRSHDRIGQETAVAGGTMQKAVEAAEAAAEAAQDEADELRDRLAETERELQRMERRSAMSGGGRGGDAVASLDGSSGLRKSGAGLMSGAGGVGAASEKEVRLEQENRKLREELQAFDLDFFEEIEDLKYKYSEAARKLRQYE